jgi:hypothetical protein
VLRLGRDRDYLLAGAAVGLAAAMKYTGGIVLLPVLIAAAVQAAQPGGRVAATRGAMLAFVAFAAGFVALNPYALLAFDDFWFGIAHQSTAAGGETTSKLGATHGGGVGFYAWTLGWGLGVVPSVAAVGALVPLWRDERRVWFLLVPTLVLFLLFMGLQGRFFARWLLPVYPVIALLAGYAGMRVVELVGARWPRRVGPALVVVGVVLCAQGLSASVHVGRVMAREDTRNATRAWMVRHVPEGSRIVIEPVVPNNWLSDPGRPGLLDDGARWEKYPTSRSRWDLRTGARVRGGVPVYLENYVRSLDPRLLDAYEQGRWCWVITGSTQRGRAEAEPDEVPRAIAYYRELDRRADLVHVSQPWTPGADPVPFDFDWSFDYYPRAYERPGAEMRVYRLRGRS